MVTYICTLSRIHHIDNIIQHLHFELVEWCAPVEKYLWVRLLLRGSLTIKRVSLHFEIFWGIR